jgi:hypothetical protein
MMTTRRMMMMVVMMVISPTNFQICSVSNSGFPSHQEIPSGAVSSELGVSPGPSAHDLLPQMGEVFMNLMNVFKK